MSIYATLRTTPTCSHTHEVIYITRGASAELMYPLYDKVFRFEDIEQLTFTFKQGKNVSWFEMFDITQDEEGKDVVSIDPHFYHFENPDYETISLNLDTVETKAFKAGCPVEYEIAVKLNTDSFASLGNKDSIIIEPQHPIEIRDSLYSRI
jgi:hypothetical protein